MSKITIHKKAPPSSKDVVMCGHPGPMPFFEKRERQLAAAMRAVGGDGLHSKAGQWGKVNCAACLKLKE